MVKTWPFQRLKLPPFGGEKKRSHWITWLLQIYTDDFWTNQWRGQRIRKFSFWDPSFPLGPRPSSFCADSERGWKFQTCISIFPFENRCLSYWYWRILFQQWCFKTPRPPEGRVDINILTNPMTFHSDWLWSRLLGLSNSQFKVFKPIRFLLQKKKTSHRHQSLIFPQSALPRVFRNFQPYFCSPAFLKGYGLTGCSNPWTQEVHGLDQQRRRGD